MTEEEPLVKKGHFYSKQQTAKLLKISRNSLRKYTQLNRIRMTTHPLSGREGYSGDDILETWSRGFNAPEKPVSSVGRFNLDNKIAESPMLREKLNAFIARRKM